MAHMIIVGKLVSFGTYRYFGEGVSYIGPFSTAEKAHYYAGIHLSDESWTVTRLTSPEMDEEDEEEDEEDDYWDRHSEYEYDEEHERRRMFADPGGNSALRAATKDNPRNLPCPNCGEPNRLTPADRQLGYQCDACADRAERGMDY
jgi:hypothetical protein